MKWGAATGSTWGGSIAKTMGARLLQFVQGGRFEALVEALGDRTERLYTAAVQIRQAFGLDDAVGVHLDRLGEILQRPRGGLGDAMYRAVLKIQVQIILASQATTENLLEVVRLYTGLPAPEYSEASPATAAIGAALASPDDSPLLLQLLREARAGGVQLTVHETDADWGAAEYLPVVEGEIFRPDMQTLVDPISGQTGVPPSGTPEYDAATDSRDFDTGKRIDWQGQPDLTAAPMSVSVWYKAQTLPNGYGIFGISNVSESSRALRFNVTSGGSERIFVEVTHATTNLVRIGGTVTNVPLGQWVHLAFTWDGTSLAAGIRLFVNGAEVPSYPTNTDGVGAITSFGDEFTIPAVGTSADALITDFRVFDRVLTPAEVEAIYTEGVYETGSFVGNPEPPQLADPGVADYIPPVEGLVFSPNLNTLEDPISGLVGTPDGSTFDAASLGRVFNGTTDRVDYPSVNPLSGDPITIACWIKADTFAVNGRPFSSQQSAGAGGPFLDVLTTRGIRFFVSSDTGGASLSKNSATGLINAGVWQHIVATWDGTSLAAGVRLFVDGAEVPSYTTSQDGSGTLRTGGFNWSIGAWFGADTLSFDGTISDVRVFDRVLTPAEVEQVYREGVYESGSFSADPGDVHVANASTVSYQESA